MSDKKKEQLGINPGTASARLVKDLLWNFIVSSDKDTCIKCGQKMTRKTFSVEHIVPWLDSEDPVGLFFDTDNIGYSHMSCNYADARRQLAEHGTLSRYKYCGCDLCKEAKRQYSASIYCPERRKAQYKRTNK